MAKTTSKKSAGISANSRKKTVVKKTSVPAPYIINVKSRLIREMGIIKNYLVRNWLGTVILIVLTAVFFWPILTRIGSYSPGGDAMFNAWEIRRNQNCILRQGCPSYTTANIFFPHKDTMLYSETQLSAGLVTLPLYWLNQNPIFAYNLLTIVSFFLSGWFMYLLAKYLSKGKEIVSILSGLIFEFAPIKMASIFHLQNLSIFCLPLAVLMIFKYIDKDNRKYLYGLLAALIYVFYASWVQMILVLFSVSILVLTFYLLKHIDRRKFLLLFLTIFLAVISTFPLAREYIRFSKTNKATFSITEQISYSSDLKDYVIPHQGTLIGKLYYRLKPGAIINSYNLDSYSYHGVVLYILSVVMILFGVMYRYKRKDSSSNTVIAFACIGLVGFIMSLGPFLKVNGTIIRGVIEPGIKIVIPLPWVVVDKFLPQLSFIRAIGRSSVLALFALCCLLALLPVSELYKKLSKKRQKILLGIIGLSILVELMPIHLVPMSKFDYSYSLSIPAVYKYIKDHKEVDNIVILNADYDYPHAPIPIATAEQVLWAGYHNKNIFNGYSGYSPRDYVKEFEDFVDFKQDDIEKLNSKDIRYVLVDKQLMKNKPWTNDRVSSLLKKIYDDKRYSLYKV